MTRKVSDILLNDTDDIDVDSDYNLSDDEDTPLPDLPYESDDFPILYRAQSYPKGKNYMN